MEFSDVVRKRRMVRTFSTDPVPDEAVERMLRNAVRAPSAGFSQGQAFLLLTEQADRDRFWGITDGEDDGYDPGLTAAPVVIIPLSSKKIYLDRYARPDKGWTDRDEARWPVPFWHIDTAMATMSILLTVVDEGLGALYFGIFPEIVDRVRAEFGIPDDHEPIGAVAIGYDAETEKRDLRSRRRPFEEVIHRGHW